MIRQTNTLQPACLGLLRIDSLTWKSYTDVAVFGMEPKGSDAFTTALPSSFHRPTNKYFAAFSIPNLDFMIYFFNF